MNIDHRFRASLPKEEQAHWQELIKVAKKEGIEHVLKKVQSKSTQTAAHERIWDEKQKGVELSGKTEHPITSKEEAIAFFEVDEALWEVERYVCNSWDVTMKDPDSGGSFKRTNYQVKLWLKLKQSVKTYMDLRDELMEEMQAAAPVFPTIKRPPNKDPHLLVLDPSDIHIGKLATTFETGEEYDIEIAQNRVKEGIIGILEKAKSHNIEKIVLVGGNDCLHIDTPFRKTTAGTPQDTSGMWYDGFKAAKKLYIDMIEMCLPIADVHFVYCPSNHDYQSGFFLADSINSWFAKSPNFSADVSIAHRKYLLYGRNLIGTTHGDGAKEQDLPDLMKTEAKQAWAEAKFGYWYTHHIHHKQRKEAAGKRSQLIEKDYMDVSVIRSNPNLQPTNKIHIEYLRSPSGTDSWHHRNGYQHSPKAIEAFIHHPEFGQVGRISHLF